MCGRCGCVSESGEIDTIHPAIIEGVLEPGLLLLLAERDGYGYELAEQLGARGLVPGLVLPARAYEILRRLEDENAVVSRAEDSPSGPGRRCYTITPTGQERLDRWVEALRLSQKHLRTLLATYNRQLAERRMRR